MMNSAQQALQEEWDKICAEGDVDVIQDGPYQGWQVVYNEKFMMPLEQQPQQQTREEKQGELLETAHRMHLDRVARSQPQPQLRSQPRSQPQSHTITQTQPQPQPHPQRQTQPSPQHNTQSQPHQTPRPAHTLEQIGQLAKERADRYLMRTRTHHKHSPHDTHAQSQPTPTPQSPHTKRTQPQLPRSPTLSSPQHHNTTTPRQHAH